jgi:hypothetical protein
MTKRLVVIFLFILSGASVFSQNLKKFEEDLEKYPETVSDMFAVNVKDADKAIIAQFTEAWNSGTFNNAEKTQILRLSNAFLEKKARNIHYAMLWQCLLSFKTPENSAKGYDAWMKAMAELCQNRRTTPTALQTVMTATSNLIDKQIVCSSAACEWKSSTGDFMFEFKDEELTVTFGTGDLYCFSKGDSIMIGQTAGRYLMSEQQWTGKGGTVTWERAGYGRDDVSARLGDYSVNMKQPQYEADSVWLTHKTYFPAPVQGKLIDKVRHNQSPETALFPEFITYNKKFVFENLYPDVSYEGGISIQGSRTIGSGDDETKALIRIEKSDSLQMGIFSKSFVFRADRINSRDVELKIRLGQDSVFHAKLSFVYLVENKEVSFVRSDAASSQSPYTDSYHKLDMEFEQLVWKTDEPLMSLSMTRGSAMGRSRFRSQNYFDGRYFESLQYFDAVHPLVSIKNCAEAYYSETFSSETYAGFIRKPVTTARAQLIEIAKLGYVTYSSDKDEVTIQQRLYDILLAASKKNDFDVIDLQSTVQAPAKNATLDTKNYDLIINGIEKFMVSDSQRIIITPKNQQVTIKKNRAIDIDGHIDAGQMEMYGDSLHFDYETYKIDLYHVDSLLMYIPSGELNAFGKPVYRKIKTAIENMSGNILIDLPDNKSGRKSVPKYPVLNSDSASYVYYSASNIEGGAYSKERFYFELEPFVIDSIDHFSKESVVLPGKFVSADIFNDMRQNLRIQPDYSLGFIYETGDSALSVYKNATMSAEVRLSNKGLQANGQLNYLTASIHTDEFKIYPDSLNVPVAKEFILRKQTEGTEYPEIQSAGNKIHWEPENDRMYIYKTGQALNMYSQQTRFDGNLLLSPEKLSGSGRIDIGMADICSDSITFLSNSFSSDTSVFRLKSSAGDGYQMVTVDSIRSLVDFNTHKAQFTPAKDFALVQFPSNKFAAYIDNFEWNMDSSRIHIGANTSQPPKPAASFKYQYPGEGNGSRYFATSREADSLNFVATSADFDYAAGKLKTAGVQLIKTADALVFPGDGRVTVGPGGILEAMRDARIVFNDTGRQHVVYDADVKILGRKTYSGSGKYDYIDETGKTSVIKISQIASDKSGKTIANGAVTKEDEFMLNPFYRFQGKMEISSGDAFAEFDGAAQIVEECETLRPEWFAFKAKVDPANVKLPVGEAPVNINNGKIFNGLFLTSDSTHIYPAFLSSRKNYSDHQLVRADGILYYDKDSMIYFIAPERKLHNRDTVGNIIAFDRNECMLSGEGKINLGIDLGRVKTDIVGKITHNLNNKETKLDVMMSFDFLLNDGLAALIASKIDSFPQLSGIDMLRARYIRGMNEWLGTGKSATFRRDALLGKVKNFPEELKHTLVLTQMNLYWNQSSRSYRSTGKIGVGNLFGHQVNRLVEGMVEISKRPGGDFLDIYLKLDGNNWFYFGYTRELMQIISSDRRFNNQLIKIPEKQRKMNEKYPGYTYMIASSDKLDQFLRQSQRVDTPVDNIKQTVPLSGENNEPVSPPTGQEEESAPIVEFE